MMKFSLGEALFVLEEDGHSRAGRLKFGGSEMM